MNDIIIKQVEINDLKDLAIIYKSLYDNANIEEHWTYETAYQLLEYWYKVQPDLFFVAWVDGKIAGAVMSGIKPYWEGVTLNDTEIFVSIEYQRLGIAKSLYKKHFELAIAKYNAVVMRANTYVDESEFPFCWYEKMGFEKDKSLFIIKGDIKKVLNKL